MSLDSSMTTSAEQDRSTSDSHLDQGVISDGFAMDRDALSVDPLDDQMIDQQMVHTTDQEMLDFTQSSLDMDQPDALLDDEVTPPYLISSRQQNYTFDYSYDRAVTSGNPLKGFTTSYRWGTPRNDFPHSLEFSYIPLSDVIQSDRVYLFDSSLEPILDEASNRGHHLILRFYLDYPSLESGVPIYLRDDVMCVPYDDYGGGCSPDYQNVQLQSTLLEFISALGVRYDGDPRIGFIQIGLLGFWGEWHTYPQTDLFADDLFQQELITAFDQAFSITPIQLRIPAQDSPQRIIGFHDDSFAYSTIGEIPWFFWPKLLNAMADQRWLLAPMGGEIYPPLQEEIFSDGYQIDVYSQDPISAIQDTHMSYMVNYQAFNLNGVGYQGVQRERAESASRLMGYEFTVDTISVELSNLDHDQVDFSLSVRIRNSGIAPFYYPLNIQLTSIASGRSWSVPLTSETLQPSEDQQELTIELESTSTIELTQGFTLQLSSPHLLNNQVIKWANTEQTNGLLTLSEQWKCQYEDQEIDLAIMVSTPLGDCFCDVDGLLYLATGQLCLE